MKPAKIALVVIIGASLLYALYAMMKKSSMALAAGTPLLTSAGAPAISTARGIPAIAPPSYGPSSILWGPGIPGVKNPSPVTSDLPLSGNASSSVYGMIDDPGIQPYMMDLTEYV